MYILLTYCENGEIEAKLFKKKTTALKELIEIYKEKESEEEISELENDRFEVIDKYGVKTTYAVIRSTLVLT
jgi:hypothetical protein